MRSGLRTWVFALLGGVASIGTLAAEDGAWTPHGLLETRQAWLSSGGEHALAEYRAELEAVWRPGPGSTVRARFSATSTDLVDVRQTNRLTVEELLIVAPARDCLFKAGVQTVAWGQADRIQVVDVVHPLDLTEWYFANWERKRLPLGMLNLDCSFADSGLQLLVVPQTRFNRRPSSLGRFAVPQAENALAAAGIPLSHAPDPSAMRVKDWSYGAQWSGRLGSFDYALYGHRGWETDRVVRQDGDGTFSLAPDRTSMMGASFSVPAGPLVFRGEAALRRDVTYYPDDTGGMPVATQADERVVLLAVDYIAAPWFVSTQYFSARAVRMADSTVGRDQRVWTIAVRRSALQNRLSLGLYAAKERNGPSHFLSIEAEYEIDPHWLLRLTAERYDGEENGIGRFKGESRYMAQLRYAF